MPTVYNIIPILVHQPKSLQPCEGLAGETNLKVSIILLYRHCSDDAILLL